MLRDAGLRLITLAEHYGIPDDERIRDEDWLELSGQHGWAVLMKDARIRYNVAERQAVVRHQVRCFCMSSQSLPALEMAQRVLRNLDNITRACEDPGPFIYAVHQRRVERLSLRET